jgi:hypothetical protein
MKGLGLPGAECLLWLSTGAVNKVLKMTGFYETPDLKSGLNLLVNLNVFAMSLSKEQRRDLNELSRHLKKIEKLQVDDNIDLDVYMTEYKEEGFAVYATEKVSVSEENTKRKKVFEKAAKSSSATEKIK